MPQDHKTTPEFQQIRQTAPERKMSYPILFIFFLPRERGHSGEELSFWGRTVVVPDTPGLSQCHHSQVSRFRITPTSVLLQLSSHQECHRGVPGWVGGFLLLAFL